MNNREQAEKCRSLFGVPQRWWAHVSADWTAIKNEYITGSDSQRQLARKYGVSQASINRRIKAEKWDESRESFRIKMIQKTTDAICDSEAERATVLSSISTKAARFLDERLDELIGSGAKAYEIKAIMETARIIRDMDKDSTHAEDDPLMKYLEDMRNA